MSEERKLVYRFAVSLGIFFTVILLNGFILTIKVDGKRRNGILMLVLKNQRSSRFQLTNTMIIA